MTAQPRSGVYLGWLRHRRTAPIAHAFTYPLFMVLLDIDQIPELMAASPFTSHNRWNWASFFDTDHLGDCTVRLRERLARDAAGRGFRLPDGPVFLLTNLRYLGYCFNPVSFFYCYDSLGALRLVLAEVSNTFGGSHRYWLEPDDTEQAAHVLDRAATTEVSDADRDLKARHHRSAGGGDRCREALRGAGDGADPASSRRRPFRAAATKSLYVSPFMPAAMQYAFSFTPPGERLVAHMTLTGQGTDGCAHAFDATLSLGFRPWNSGEIVRALVKHPAMTVRVMAGIHWQALGLWWKGLPIVPRPTPTGVQPEPGAPEVVRL